MTDNNTPAIRGRLISFFGAKSTALLDKAIRSLDPKVEGDRDV